MSSDPVGLVGQPQYEFEVESGVPVPERVFGRPPANAKYPYALMKVGDSFFVPGVETLSKPRKVEGGPRYTMRRVDGGIRVWRVS